jgi:hypothetical protein
MAKTGSAAAGGKALMFGGRKGAATPPRNSVADTNTKQMSSATWTPRHLRRKS